MICLPDSTLAVTTVDDLQAEILRAIRELGPLHYLLDADDRLSESSRWLARRYCRSPSRLPALLLLSSVMEPLLF
ncbi:hypothetical protein F6A13_03620 [Acidithiobacillus sp. 'AMD consortium']|uniref:hypothetical protein n=1 Tax=Acidithiobacillus sp. 'AMD consortium' TaxID=2614801 RepID=UPI00124EA21C|nr:hypothetical protein [Acidithiobacillus sp. 'AMD consortium']QFG77824.1 hypothetical protein F6A13_03620 [Acidithiobacillus sp. 'AMD consortium']